MINIRSLILDLLGEICEEVDLISRASGNNAVYRVSTDKHKFAIKVFSDQSEGDNLRFKRELFAMTFFREGQFTQAPLLIAADKSLKVMIFEWLEGDAPAQVSEEYVNQAWDFIEQINSDRSSLHLETCELATEACLALSDIFDQINNRLELLEREARAQKLDLGEVLSRIDCLFPKAWDNARTKYNSSDIDPEKSLSKEFWVLSPSDFGSHNAIETPNGVRFIDFEFFGWDDPAKLTSDFLLHPAMNLPEAMKKVVLARARDVFSYDATFSARLDAVIPLYGLRWALIILNPIREDHWERQLKIGVTRSRKDVIGERLERANEFIDRVERGLSAQ